MRWSRIPASWTMPLDGSRENNFDFLRLALATMVVISHSYDFVPSGRLSGFARRRDLSYGVYLYAWPVQLLVARWAAGSLSPLAISLASAPPIAFLALASWHLVERPALQLKGRKPN